MHLYGAISRFPPPAFFIVPIKINTLNFWHESRFTHARTALVATLNDIRRASPLLYSETLECQLNQFYNN